jgi:hypothetical protein
MRRRSNATASWSSNTSEPDRPHAECDAIWNRSKETPPSGELLAIAIFFRMSLISLIGTQNSVVLPSICLCLMMILFNCFCLLKNGIQIEFIHFWCVYLSRASRLFDSLFLRDDEETQFLKEDDKIEASRHRSATHLLSRGTNEFDRLTGSDSSSQHSRWNLRPPHLSHCIYPIHPCTELHLHLIY